jgi:GDPmannose 4,6-dehydratase
VAFGYAGLDWEKAVVRDPEFYRPAEVDLLVSDPTKARTVLGWKPEFTFADLIEMMVDADLAHLRQVHGL